MNQQKYWKGLTPLQISSEQHIPERIIKLCSNGVDYIALSADHTIYFCSIEADTLHLKKVPGLLAIDIACSGNILYTIDVHGRIIKTKLNNPEDKEEIVIKEEAKSCSHGFKTCGYKLKFKNVGASDFGQIFVSTNGQLWGSGDMPQMSLNNSEIKKISFFEGRSVFGVSLGSNFASVIARKNTRNSMNHDSDSEDEEVFISTCLQCQSTYGLSSPLSAQSLSDTCPLGMQISKSSDDTSSTSAPHTDIQGDAHSITGDTSPSTEDSNATRRLERTKYGIKENGAISDTAKDGTQNGYTVEKGVEHSSLAFQPNHNNIFINTEAAKQFLSRQLSWVSVGEDYIVEYTEKPTRIIKENVSNLTNFVYEGVKTVGDKVATLSRHMSGSSDNNDPAEVNENYIPDDINSILLSCASSCKVDDLQISTSTLESERDFLNMTNEKATNLVKIGQSILNTEVWTWGDISHGQLGVGDIVKRTKPMLVSSLSGLGIQKVSCGKCHCAALTLDGRIFSWGKNDFHQVSFTSREDKSGPTQFKENSSTDRIRDVVASEDHSILYTHNQNLFYMGKYPSGYSENVKNLKDDIENFTNTEEQMKPPGNSDIHISSKSFKTKCNHWRVLTSGNLNYFFLDEKSQSPTLHDLSVAQKILEEFLLIYHSLIKPFLKRSVTITAHTSVYEVLCESFANILYITALNVLSMWQYIESHINEAEISIIKYADEYIYTYRKYLIALCNAISISGFTQISNVIDVSMVIHNLFNDQLPTCKQKNNKKANEAVIALAFLLPLTRLSSYKFIIQSLLRRVSKSSNKESNASIETKLRDVLAKWDGLNDEIEKRKCEAEITKLFWETSGKSIDQYKTPERRLIRESKSRPINLLHAGRFASHWFILLNDVLLHVNGSTHIQHPLQTLWVELIANTDNFQNALQLLTPEESITVYTTTSQEKTEWYQAFQAAIKSSLNKASGFQPPAVRSASYNFTNKSQFFKDTKYTGRWLNGKLHGSGKVEWPDGKVYIGNFQINTLNGHGKMDIPAVGVYEGQWKDNLQNGYGVMKYVSGDIHEGYFKDGLAHGHGVRKQGDFTTSTATIYMGEWNSGARDGYGVMDDIGKGEKYLGSWNDNKKHGCGLIVTLDGIYYEGVFMQDVLTGHGVMVFEDGTHYEGEFRSAGVFSGKGVLTFSSGDKISGSLNGAWTDGVKISNATLQMNVSSPALPENSKPNSFGKLCVAPNQKWNGLFRQCFQQLGISETVLTPNGNHFLSNGTGPSVPTDNKKIWQNVAVMISSSHKDNFKKGSRTHFKMLSHEGDKSHDHLELIPQFGQKMLSLDSYVELKQYMQRACESLHHPLGRLVQDLTTAFNTTYGGVRVHPLLLSHAVKELKSITSRLYQIVRLLFPALPADGSDLVLPYKTSDVSDEDRSPIDGEVVSAAALLQPTLLPRVHPSLFVLYALHNKREDDLYWRRLLKWNRQPDITLMAFLGIDQKFWVGYSTQSPQTPSSAPFSPLKEQLFNDAVETLQQLKTTFSPIEKLLVIRSTFQQMTAAVQGELGENYLWSMDELFPVFHFVVVRARILQLGSEIHFIEDFLEPCMQHGELGIMFTTLKACYFQILQEKMTINS